MDKRSVVSKYGKVISVNMLGVQFDRNLEFDNHVNKLCKKVGRKLSA